MIVPPVIETAAGQKLGGQAAQAVLEIIVSKEYARVNDFKGVITVAAGVSAKVADLSLMDTMRARTCGNTCRRPALGR